MDRKKKLLIIGLDGASHPLVMKWTGQGKLPNLGRLMKSGTGGMLRSTTPPITFPAVPTFSTGRNPGGHGIASFFRPNKDGSLGLVHSGMLKNEFWNVPGMRALPKVIVNLPLTFPAKKIKGCVVTGTLTPSTKEEGMCYPRDLRERYSKEFKNYIVDVDMRYVPGRERDYLKECEKAASRRTGLALALLNNEEWSLGIVYYTLLDRIQHFMFGLDGNKWILEGYKLADRAVGELLEGVGGETDVVLFSDHGFGRSAGRFYPNAWLAEKGYLVYKGWQRKGNKKGIGSKLMPNLRYLQANKMVCWASSKVPNFIVKKGVHILEDLNNSYNFSTVDLDRSRAYSTINGIYLNEVGRNERPALVEEITKELKKLVNPVTGKKLKVRVFSRDEVYRGPLKKKLPDIVYSIEDYAFEPFASFEPQKPVQVFEREFKGWHREEGLFIFSGPGFKKAKVKEAGIADIAPTVLSFFGAGAPEGMDGNRMDEVLCSEARAGVCGERGAIRAGLKGLKGRDL